MTCLS